MTEKPVGETYDILLVEDNPGDARLLEEYLSRSKQFEAEPDRAGTLEAALDRLRNGACPPDVVLLGLGLPDAGGLEAVESVVEAAPDLPVVVLAGRDDRRTAVEALREGAEDYLLEGDVEPDALARSVRYALERKRADRELEAERGRLAEIFDAAPASIAAMRGEEHVFEMVNPAFRDLVGDRELIGRPVREVFPDLEGEGYFDLLDHVYESGETVKIAERSLPLETEEGGTDEKFITFVFQPRRENGNVVRITAHGVDVTEEVQARRVAERAERERERLTSILEATPDYVAAADPDGEIQWVNEPGREMLAVPEDEELVGRSVESTHPDWAIEQIREEPFPTGRKVGVWRGESALLTHDGREIPVSQIILAHRSPDGELRYFSTIARDISESKAKQHALEESEARFRQMAENIEEVFWLRDPENEEMLYVSPAYEEIFGRSVEELYERPQSWLEAVHPEDRDRVERAVLEDDAPSFEEEYRVVRPDGEVRWIHDRGVPVRNEEGEIYRVTGAARDVTERKRMEEELRYRALHDGLTDLPNRTLFEDRLEQTLERSHRRGHLVGVLILDVDRFKRVNDQYGHAVGDRLLEEVAERLQSTLRGEDTAARLGGDEFGVLLPDLGRPEHLTDVRTRLMRALGDSYRLGGERMDLDMTMGGVLHGGDAVDRAVTVEETDDLLRCADLALHQAKDTRGSSFHFFRPEEDSKAGRAFAREQELRRAVREEEFELRWQPIVRLEDGAVQAAEPLARWRHPEHGVLSPVSFIPLAEETGLIQELGELLFRQVCREAANWPEGDDVSVRLTPNLSGGQFDGTDLASTLLEIADEAGLEPDRFWLEITETEILRAREAVETLRDLGFGVFVDDFGTGHSSFHYLRDYRFEGLKIDMSFVHGLGDGDQGEALVETMITMGRTMDMRVVAEGIETEEQRNELVDLGCDLGQGFLFARPMSIENLRDWMEARS